jgi:hypothetical protein
MAVGDRETSQPCASPFACRPFPRRSRFRRRKPRGDEIVELDSCVADVAEPLSRVLLETSPQQRPNLAGVASGSIASPARG